MKKFNQFKSSGVPRCPRSSYDKSCDFLYTQHFGSILPVGWQDLAPGEDYDMQEAVKLLSVPYFAPMFSQIRSKTRYFAVPIRKLVPYWEEFCTQLPDDGIVEPYTTVGDVFISAFGHTGSNSGNLLVQDAINPGGIADMLGWPQFIDQLHIILTGFDTQGYQEQLASLPGLTDIFATIWTSIMSSINSNFVAGDREEDVPLDPVVFSYHIESDGKGEYLWVKDSEDPVSLESFFLQRLRLLPFLAYQKIIFDWFVDLRFLDDQFTLVNPYFEYKSYVPWNANYTIDAADTISGVQYSVLMLPFLLTGRVVDYAKDYFTTCSPDPQQGPDLVIGPDKLAVMFNVETSGVSSSSAVVGPGQLVSTGDHGELYLTSSGGGSAIGKVWAEVNQADEITPIKLRWQMALQRLLELRNVGGYRRYTDYVLAQTGIRVPDPYMQRSYYLGGWSQSIGTQEVVAFSDGNDGDGSSSILGEQGAYGRDFQRGPAFKARIANEHVVVMALNYVVPQNYYTQGLATRNTEIGLLDWPHYQFANVGEQPVYEREIFFGLVPDAIFGYNTRYSDRTDQRDQVHGEFLSTLRYWHTGRKFLSQPKLGSSLLPLRGSDGHNQVLAVSPDVAEPFRFIRYQRIRHVMNIPRVRRA